MERIDEIYRELDKSARDRMVAILEQAEGLSSGRIEEMVLRIRGLVFYAHLYGNVIKEKDLLKIVLEYFPDSKMAQKETWEIMNLVL